MPALGGFAVLEGLVSPGLETAWPNSLVSLGPGMPSGYVDAHELLAAMMEVGPDVALDRRCPRHFPIALSFLRGRTHRHEPPHALLGVGLCSAAPLLPGVGLYSAAPPPSHFSHHGLQIRLLGIATLTAWEAGNLRIDDVGSVIHLSRSLLVRWLC